MKLAAIDADELADGSGKATMTWIAVELINSEYHMNPNDTNKGGWPESEMRIWLRESIMPLFPENVKSNIKEVTKYTYSETSTISSKDTIWIPSMREVAGAGGDSYEPYSRFTICWENRGPMYISAFPNNKTMKKYHIGASASSWWWLRSASNICDDTPCFVYYDGDWDINSASSEGGVAFGFCL